MRDLSNVYQSPQARVDSTNFVEPNQTTWYHFSGRIGRLRYLSYRSFIGILSMLLVFVIGALVGMMGIENTNAESAITALSYIAFLPMFIYNFFIFPIRRLNDLNKTGWLLLLIVVPLVNIFFLLYLVFAKGDPDVNQYGAPPRENRWYHWLSLAFPVFILICILAAISLPAYQDYLERAQAVQTQMQSEQIDNQ